MQVQVHVVRAFVDGNAGGNPAGVVLEADALTTKQKQRVATEVGLSETAFVSQSTLADFKLDFFTPTRQIAHCGHATVATFAYLKQTGRLSSDHTSKETIDGRREILLQGEQAFLQQTAPTYAPVTGTLLERMLQSLNLTPEYLLPQAPVQVVNTGNSFALIPLRTAHLLQHLQPDLAAIAQISEELNLVGYYSFYLLPATSGRTADTRMFAPSYGINEEAATGMAAGPLACYLYEVLGIRQSVFLLQQGHYMNPPSPSVLQANVLLNPQGAIHQVLVGGRAQLVESFTLSL
jgi:PhzF family phenazine biosynthesis protein